MENTNKQVVKNNTESVGVTETQTKQRNRIQVVERICHCGYCKFCNDSNGTKYFQVYLDNKPVCAGLTKEEALEEYDAFVERMSEREHMISIGEVE